MLLLSVCLVIGSVFGSATEKPHISVCFIGTSNAGKSTMVGHLITEFALKEGKIIDYSQGIVEGGFNVNEQMNYAFVVDQRPDERRDGSTVECSIRDIELKRFRATLRESYCYRGVSLCDHAVLVISSDKLLSGSSEKSHEGKQILDLIELAYGYGIKSLYVAINKIDIEAFDFQQLIYHQIVSFVLDLMKSSGYSMDAQVKFIAISGLDGDNLILKSNRTPWYTGNTLVEALENLDVVVHHKESKMPLRVPIFGIHYLSDYAKGVTGRIESGYLSENMSVVIGPLGIRGQIRELKLGDQRIDKALAGYLVRFLVNGVSLYPVKSGHVCGSRDYPPKLTTYIEANLTMFHTSTPIIDGSVFKLYCHTSKVQCSVRVSGEKSKYIRAEITTKEPMSPELFVEYPRLGRILLFNKSSPVAYGTVIRTDIVDWY
ncbi:hypothetical protein ACOME3_001823 [Neoechinorhynchus agilis]